MRVKMLHVRGDPFKDNRVILASGAIKGCVDTYQKPWARSMGGGGGRYSNGGPTQAIRHKRPDDNIE